ncbi:MAG: glycosyl transferase family 1 [Acidobacteria bacterium]|nr:MAG: glycosyl transferase family 1 [Acidobacteriota bacterium]
MRVLMTADTIGGVWTYALELARALAQDDVEFTIATMGEPVTRDQRRDIAALDNVDLVESRFKLEWMDEPWEDVDRAGEWLLDLASASPYDVIHLNGYAHAGLPFTAPRLVVAHSCVFSWWRAVHGDDPPHEWREYFARVQRGLASVDLLVAPTWAMLDAIRAIYGVDVPSRVIHNCRAGSFAPHANKEPFVLSAGRLWDDAKNVAALVRVAPSLSWPVRVAGEAKEKHIANVASLGRLDCAQLAEQYAFASIYCLPARYEPFGLTVLEAALSRCALVLGDIPSLRELWDGAAIFVPNYDDSLRDALTRLIEDHRLRDTLGAAAMRRAQAFTPRTTARRYLSAYHELMREPAEAIA